MLPFRQTLTRRRRASAVGRWAPLTAAFAAAVLVLAGCSRPSAGAASDAGDEVLKVASQRGSTKALLEASGALKGAPYRIEWSEFAAASPLLEALSAGAVDVGGVGDAPFVFAYAAGAPIKVVQAYVTGTRGNTVAVVVPPGSPIRTVADLRGRKVTTVKGSIGHFLLLRLLDRAGVPAKDVQSVFLEPGASRAALTSGSVDAWATWSPYIGLATLYDKGRILADGKGVLSGVGFFAANDGAIARKGKLLADFLSRLATAQAWARTHPEAYAVELAKDTGLPLDVARDSAARLAVRDVPVDAALIAEEYSNLETFRRAGVIDAAPRIDQAFAPQFSAPAAASTAPPAS